MEAAPLPGAPGSPEERPQGGKAQGRAGAPAPARGVRPANSWLNPQRPPGLKGLSGLKGLPQSASLRAATTHPPATSAAPLEAGLGQGGVEPVPLGGPGARSWPHKAQMAHLSILGPKVYKSDKSQSSPLTVLLK